MAPEFAPVRWCTGSLGNELRLECSKSSGTCWDCDEASVNRHVMKLVAATLASMMCARPVDGRKSKLNLYLSYDYDEVRRIVHLARFEPAILGRRNEWENKRQCGARARCGGVERTHSWLNRFRRLLVRCEKREGTYLAMLQFACGLIAWHSALKK